MEPSREPIAADGFAELVTWTDLWWDQIPPCAGVYPGTRTS